MKKTLILSAVSLCLLASANATASNEYQRLKEVAGDDRDEILVWSSNSSGYAISNYQLRDLNNFKEQLRLQEQTIKKLESKLSDMERVSQNQNSEIGNLKRKLEEQDNNQREISNLKRSVQDISNKIK
jgi:predicted RNase H-like nuclease (RuvC/YqgF family)